MKRRLEPRELEALAARGRPREPDALARYRRGEPGVASGLGSFPHGRFCLVVDLACPREPDTRVLDTRVGRFYRGLLPWLLVGQVEGPTAQRWIDLVDLIDELVEREHSLFDAAAPWPLAELTAVVAEVAQILAREPNPFAPADWDAGDHAGLRDEFAGHAASLAAHRECCHEARINVHWW